MIKATVYDASGTAIARVRAFRLEDAYAIWVFTTGADPALPLDAVLFRVWRRDEVLPRVEMIVSGLTPKGGRAAVMLDF